MKIKYNNNIIIKGCPAERQALEKNEFYALMVTDAYKKKQRPENDYFDYDKSWIGIERTDDRIYISKDFAVRNNKSRGDTCIVLVKDTKLCCVLSGKYEENKKIKKGRTFWEPMSPRYKDNKDISNKI